MNAEANRVGVNSISGSATALRRVFDESFSVAVASTTERLEDLLAIRVGGDPYALRLSEITGLHATPKIVAVPTPAAQLLGIIGLRGVIAPVYDLAALLHYPSAENPRWMVLSGLPQAVGFVFETFETHVRVPEASLAERTTQSAGSDATKQHTQGTVRAAGALRPIIHITSVLKSIKGHRL